MRVDLLIIDMQKDFCDKNGALYVPGADKDVDRLSKMIDKFGSGLHSIHATLDSHHYVDVAHPIFLMDKKGNHPAPFTVITEEDVMAGVWKTTERAYQNRKSMEARGIDRDGFEEYVSALKANGRYPLMVWPPHCLIGHGGSNFADPLAGSLLKWESSFNMVNCVTKGSNIFTEHYSAVQADVPDPSDPSTLLNTQLIETLDEADVVLLAGEALSHCLANTGRDIADNFGEDSMKKIVILEDATSSVDGCSNMGEDFMNEMINRGMKVDTTVNILK